MRHESLSREEQGENHLKIARDLYAKAVEEMEGPDFKPHMNVEFRQRDARVRLLVEEAESNLNYAEQFGTEPDPELREQIMSLWQKVRR